MMPLHPSFAHCVHKAFGDGRGVHKLHAELGRAGCERGRQAFFIKWGQLGGERRNGLQGQLRRAGGGRANRRLSGLGERHFLK
jgi:hypothetical protein